MKIVAVYMHMYVRTCIPTYWIAAHEKTAFSYYYYLLLLLIVRKKAQPVNPVIYLATVRHKQ